MLWCAVLGAALAFGVGLAAWMRIGLLTLLAGLGWRGWVLLRLQDRWAPRRLGWDSQGRWTLTDRRGRLHYVELQRAPGRLGPLLWLPLRGACGSHQVLIDARSMEPGTLAALKARLRLGGPG